MPDPDLHYKLSQSLSQFRTSYPNGSLATELLQLHHDDYVVRAVVRLGETIVATGMAASPYVEQAEDRARLRALEVLGILPLPMISSSVPTLPTLPVPELPTIPEADDRPSPTSYPSLSEPLPPSSAEINSMTVNSTGTSSANPAVAKLHKPMPREQPSNLSSVPSTLTNQKPSPSSSHSPNQNVVSQDGAIGGAAPIDLSEIIDQTSFEMKRLGWTTEQGRQFLKQRFGKESRQQLDTHELEQFLEHLKSLQTQGHLD